MIRRDLFAVKADERDGAGMCDVYISRCPQRAFAKCREIKTNLTLGINRLAKLVHPSQLVVDVWCAAGNPIR